MQEAANQGGLTNVWCDIRNLRTQDPPRENRDDKQRGKRHEAHIPQLVSYFMSWMIAVHCHRAPPSADVMIQLEPRA